MSALKSVIMVDTAGTAQVIRYEISLEHFRWMWQKYMAERRTEVVNTVTRKLKLAKKYPGLYPGLTGSNDVWGQ